ncbi:MAG: response regulator transcription factor [Actinomycetota bacterium]|nr:response regulator transcription factor [Actinomycetota bacterium]
MEDALKVVLADDHTIFLDALTAILTQVGHEVLAAVPTCSALRDVLRAMEPDICILESQLRDGCCTHALADMIEASPATKFVVLTGAGDPEALHAALDAGVSGYVHKSRGIDGLLDVLARVSAGEVVIEGSFIRPSAREPRAPEDLVRLATFLTERELECLDLLASGMSTAMMTRRLGVSTTTIRSHVQSVLTKLGVHSRLEAAALANRYHIFGGQRALATRAIGD